MSIRVGEFVIEINTNYITDITMKANEFITEAANMAQQAAKAIAMKKAGKKPKSVAEGSLNEGQYEMMMRNGQVKKFIAKDDADAKRIAAGHGAKSVIKLRGGVPAGKVAEQGVAEGENWSKHNNKRVGGMSKKSVSVYRREHPGSKIQTAVTTKPSKLKKGSKAAKRRASFCARMRGMKKHRTSAKTARDPNSNINKSLRRWNCESIQEMRELVMLAEQFIQNNRKK